VVLLSAALVFLWIRFGWRRRALRRCLDNPDVLGPFVATLRDDGLSIKSPTGIVELPWEELKGKESNKFFVLANQSGEFAVLPKWILTEGSFWAALDQVRHYLQLNGGVTKRFARFIAIAVKSAVAFIFLLLFVGDIDYLARIDPGRRLTRPPWFDPGPAEPHSLRGEGEIYLVPLGQASSMLSPDLIESYRRKYGIEMKVMAPLPLPDWTKDSIRNQRIADELIEAIGDAYPDYLSSKKVVIGVTSDDMYDANAPREYELNFQRDDRLGVISTARLSQSADGNPTADQVERRFRKLLTNNLGYLYYRLLPRRAPYSVLYAYVRAPSDLDAMAEDLTEEDVEINKHLPLAFSGDPCITLHHHYFSTGQRTDRAYFSPCTSGSRQLDVEAMDVDLRYGIFSTTRTEFSLPDSIPLHFTRVTRNLDPRSRALGVGGSHNLNLFPVGNTFPFTWINLLLEHGGPIRYKRANIGFGYWDSFYRERDEGDSEFSRSTMAWIWSGWRIRTESGREYLFPPGGGYPEQSALSEIRDRKDRLTLERNGDGHLLVARSPSGKELRFTYDGSHRIQRIEGDGTWREYRYDSQGYLSQVTSPRQTTEYRRVGRSLSIISDGEVLLEGEFDDADRLVQFGPPNGVTYKFEYPPDVEKKAGVVTVLDSRGGVLQFDLTSGGYTVQVVK